MPDPSFTTSPTGAGLIAFLDYSIKKGYLKVATGQAMKTAVREVLSATEGADGWGSVDLDVIDLQDVLRRFETLRAMKFSTGSLNTYKGRFQKSLTMFSEFRANPATWRPNVKQRTRNSKSDVSPERPSSEGWASSAAPSAPPTTSHSATIITYPFPIREGVLASIELPANLTRREARRIAAFVDSLAVDDLSEGQSRSVAHEEAGFN